MYCNLDSYRSKIKAGEMPWHDFDDIALVPGLRQVESRSHVSLNRGISSLPVMPANMTGISSSLVVALTAKKRSLAAVHRYMTPETQGYYYNEIRKYLDNDELMQYVAVSLGTSDGWERFRVLRDLGLRSNCVIVIDVAHADYPGVWELIDKIKSAGDYFIIAGNVCTPEATDGLFNAGADVVKVGIGPGKVCTTREVTGFGLPQFTAIAMCSEVERDGHVIMADGGFNSVGDIAKALAAGANYVMTGSLFSTVMETESEIGDPVEPRKSTYFGMASFYAKQIGDRHIEGTLKEVNKHHSFEHIWSKIEDGLRSAVSYAGGTDIADLSKSLFVPVTPNYKK